MTTIDFLDYPSVSIQLIEREICKENVKIRKKKFNGQIELLILVNVAKLNDKDDT